MIKDCKLLTDRICKEIKENVDIAVVGLSGGADSSLTAILSMKALGAKNVYGISMPYNDVDLKTFNLLSQKLANKLEINHLVRQISKISDAIDELNFINSSSELSKLNRGNSRSRSRMCVLYGLANTLSNINRNKRVRVMGTGNLSEDFIGYDTKGGDALADIFPIGELFKSEVYQLLDYFKSQGVIEEEFINRVPSAGLEEGQTDEKDLGFSYDSLEPAMRFCRKLLEENNYNYTKIIDMNHSDKLIDFVWKRHVYNKHKHEAQKVIKIRTFCD